MPGMRFGISVWLDRLQPAACQSAGKAPVSNARAAIDSAAPNHPSACRPRASECLDPLTDLVAISTLAHPCLLPQPTHQQSIQLPDVAGSLQDRGAPASLSE